MDPDIIGGDNIPNEEIDHIITKVKSKADIISRIDQAIKQLNKTKSRIEKRISNLESLKGELEK